MLLFGADDTAGCPALLSQCIALTAAAAGLVLAAVGYAKATRAGRAIKRHERHCPGLQPRPAPRRRRKK